ncbi:hypothetical protein ABMA28_000193, partial [Loxostege sticticalis]
MKEQIQLKLISLITQFSQPSSNQQGMVMLGLNMDYVTLDYDLSDKAILNVLV